MIICHEPVMTWWSALVWVFCLFHGTAWKTEFYLVRSSIPPSLLQSTHPSIDWLPTISSLTEEVSTSWLKPYSSFLSINLEKDCQNLNICLRITSQMSLLSRYFPMSIKCGLFSSFYCACSDTLFVPQSRLQSLRFLWSAMRNEKGAGLE